MTKVTKYFLCSNAGVQSDREDELEEFTQEDYEKFEDGTLDNNLISELAQQAAEQQNFEWWVEAREIEEKD